MKSCPQCSAAYPDEYKFCLIDGTTLKEPDAEQETVVKNRIEFSIPSPAGFSLNCTVCGVENSSDSRFCKNCGAPLHEPVSGSLPPPNPASGEDRGTGTTADGGRRSLLPIIAVVLLGSFIIAAAIIYSSQAGPVNPESGNNANKSPKTSATPTPTSTPTPPPPKSAMPANTATPANITGKTGRLSTNQRIRAASNMYAEILGVHYQGAQVEVLEETSYDTEDGPSTWYRVRVVRNGCDREGVMGCGNDFNGKQGKAAMEGWMNARHITLD